MICQEIPLWEDRPEVVLQTYLLRNSSEFDQGRKRPAALVLPGGGYMGTSDREAEQVALAFAARGYHALVLRYSCREAACMPQPIVEGFKALALIRARAEAWFVDPARIAACGFSAGGHLASALATMWPQPQFAETLGAAPEAIRPDAVILGYPLIVLPYDGGPLNTGVPAAAMEAFRSQAEGQEWADAAFVQDGTIFIDVAHKMHGYLTGKSEWTADELAAYSTDRLVSAETAPSFVWTTRPDALVPVSHSLRYVQAMLDHGRNVEFHLFAEGAHGLSLATDLTAGSPEMVNTEAAVWFEMAIAWLAQTWG